MKFYDQTEFSDPENNIKGNCLSACLASILDIDIKEIPNFCYFGNNWASEFSKFIYKAGYNLDGSYYFKGLENDLREWADLLTLSSGVDGVFIVGGPSPRFNGNIHHAVLYKDNKLLHDPHPSRDGITVLRYAFLITKQNN